MTNSSDHQDFPAPQRPKLWLLRTRRFWFGFGWLAFLIALWLGSGDCQASLSVELSSVKGVEVYKNVFGLFVENGTFGIERTFGTLYLFIDKLFQFGPWGWSFHQSDDEINLLPKLYSKEFIGYGQAGFYDWRITLPLWLPVLLWLIIWPLWIRRLTRKEAAHFAKLQ